MNDDLDELNEAWRGFKAQLWLHRRQLGAYLFIVWLVAVGNGIIQYGLH